jgi:hypothetical protein
MWLAEMRPHPTNPNRMGRPVIGRAREGITRDMSRVVGVRRGKLARALRFGSLLTGVGCRIADRTADPCHATTERDTTRVGHMRSHRGVKISRAVRKWRAAPTAPESR